MRDAPEEGVCHLCGQLRPLSFEHIPPKRVFNDRPLALRTLDTMGRGWKGRAHFRRGLGRRTLCTKCNGITASLYGSAFAEWTEIATCHVARFHPHLLPAIATIPFDIMPARVLKQILTMALAATGDGESDRCGELQRFILSVDRRYLPPEYGVYAYLNPTGARRLAANVAVLRSNEGIVNYVLAEVAFPPMGYCVVRLAHNEQSIPAMEGLSNISCFSRFSHNERRTIWLEMSSRTPTGPYPLAYAETGMQSSPLGDSVFCVGPVTSKTN